MTSTPDLETACLDAIQHWSSLKELAGFAAQRHGYGDSNGGFGIHYPGDLDKYDRYAEVRFIPPGTSSFTATGDHQTGTRCWCRRPCT